MTTSLSVIHLTDTGQVLAAFSRTTDPSGTVAVEDVVGADFLLRGNHFLAAENPLADAAQGEWQTHLAVPASACTVTNLDWDEEVLRRPTSYLLDGGALVTLSGTLTGVDVSLDATHCKHNPASALGLAEGQQVWALLQRDDGSVRRVASGAVDENNEIELPWKVVDGDPAPAPSGSYLALICIAGHSPLRLRNIVFP